jgi:hypothetical protein
MPPKRKGGQEKQADGQSQQTALTNQPAPVITPAQGRQAPRDRSAPSEDAGLHSPPGTASLLAGSASSAEILDDEMDELADVIEAAEKTQKHLAEQHEASVAAARKARDRLRLLLGGSSVVAHGGTLTDARAPAQSALTRTPASAESTRSPGEVDDVRLLVDSIAVDKERAKRLSQVLSMSLPTVHPPNETAADPASRKRFRAPQIVVHPWELPTNTASDWTMESAPPGPFENEVSITGRSQALPSQGAVDTLAASYVKHHVFFADSSPEYASMPAVHGAQAAADALIANLRVALQNPQPTPGTIAWITRHLAAAAPSLIVGISGSLVGHLLHTRASATDLAFSRVAALGDRVDQLTVLEMISRQCTQHMADAGTDTSVFVRQCIRTLLVDQNKRTVKQAFTSSATAAAAASHAQPQSYLVPPPPPGLGYQSSPAPIPPMIGLPDQTYSQRLRRWIRYPRDSVHNVIMSACMLCGKGSVPGSIGHRSDQCQAQPAERDQWVQQKIAVQ